jgi:uncharacterized membrane protein
MKKKKNDRKKIALVLTILMVILFFIALTVILVFSGLSGDFSNAVLPVISLTVSVLIAIIGVNSSNNNRDGNS